jgi:hypothetical protein
LPEPVDPADAFSALMASLPPLPRSTGARAVGETADLRRIRDAPRRRWQDAPDLDQLIARLTAHLRTPHGTQVLRPVQAATLRDLHDHKGAYALIRTDGGKTLVSLLAAEVLQAARPLLLVPASLQEKTRREAYLLAREWRIRPLRICSYESLSRVSHAHALEQWAPDLIVADEADALKNSSGARSRRLGRYLGAHPDTYLLLMTGSPTGRSIMDYWHLLRWCLRGGAPVPQDPMEATQWAWALDEKVAELTRLEPGALLTLSAPVDGDGEGITAARKRYARRLLTTPGVLGTGTDLPDVRLSCRIERLSPSPVIVKAVEAMRATWETPCGLPFETAIELWRHERELSCGLYYRWRVQPPREWLDARRAWSKWCRGVLSSSRSLDTPLAVVRAVEAGGLRDGGVLAGWRGVEDTFRPDTEPVWLCDRTVQWCARWLAAEGAGLCWVSLKGFGERLSELTGIPYFREGGCDERGRSIDGWAGPAIVSVQSCYKGFNLQWKQWRNLVTTCPNGKQLEQLISRTHRGEQEKTVTVEFLQMLEGDEKALAQVRADDIYSEETTEQPRRLSVAAWKELI